MKSHTKEIALGILVLMLLCELYPTGCLGATDQRYSKDSSLSKVDASYLGQSTADYAGESVAILGDVNGDGYDDMLIGEPGNNTPKLDVGRVQLIFGAPSGYKMNTTLSSVGTTIVGVEENSSIGRKVDGVGDVNGDGYADFIIGTNFLGDCKGRPGEMCVYLFLGHPGPWPKVMNITQANASYHARGTIYSSLNTFAAGVGDVNGDGLDDFIVGGWLNFEHGAGSDYVCLILGKRTGWQQDVSLNDSDATFYDGSADNIIIGDFLHGRGDVNGDSYDDFIIGGSYGRSYLVLGKPSGWAKDTNLTSTAILMTGPKDGVAGATAAIVMDVNGDGLDDILIGEPWADVTATDCGRIYLFLGKRAGWPKTINITTSAEAIIHGEGIYDRLSAGGFAGGDLNGDGLGDIIVSSPDYGPAYTGVGKTYIFLGRASGWSKITNLSQADYSFVGDEDSEYSGLDLASGGDVNGDGLDDLLIGAPAAHYFGFGSGAAYLIMPFNNSRRGPMVSLKAYSDPDCKNGTSTVYFNQTVYFQMVWVDGDPLTQETALVRISSLASNLDGIVVNFTETGLSTGIYRGRISPRSITDPSMLWLKAMPGEVITARSLKDPTKFAKVTVLAPVTPPLVLKAFSDPDCRNETSTVYLNQTIYYQLNWMDLEPSVQDTVEVRISSSVSLPGGFIVNFTETGLSTGIYRGQISPRPSTNIGKLWLKALPNETITARSLEDPKKIANVTVLSLPIPELTLKAYSDPDCKNETSTVLFNQTVYYEIHWIGGAPIVHDLVQVRISSSVSDPGGFVVTFTKTSDVYRGQISPRPSTDQGKLWLKALPGEMITARSLNDPKKSVNVTVLGLPDLDVWIRNPKQGQVVRGQVKALGNASGPEGFQVEVNLDGKGWTAAEGSVSWTYLIQSKNLTVGSHTLQARAKWNGYYSKVRSVTFRVESKKTTYVDNLCSIFWLLLFVTISVTIVGYELWKNRPKILK